MAERTGITNAKAIRTTHKGEFGQHGERSVAAASAARAVKKVLQFSQTFSANLFQIWTKIASGRERRLQPRLLA